MRPDASRTLHSYEPFSIARPRDPAPLAEALVSGSLIPRRGDPLIMAALGDLFIGADAFEQLPYTRGYQLVRLEHHTELSAVHMAPLGGGILADPLELIAAARYSPAKLGEDDVLTARRVFAPACGCWVVSPRMLKGSRGFVLAARLMRGPLVELFMLELDVIGQLNPNASILTQLG